MEPTTESDLPSTSSSNTLPSFLSVLALIISCVSLYFTFKPMHTVTQKDNTQAIKRQNEKQAEFTLQLASALHDPSASLHLYHMALSNTHSADLKKNIQARITALHQIGHHDTKVSSHLYKQLLSISASIDHLKPIVKRTQETKPIRQQSTPWQKAKDTLWRFVHVERIPDRVMYDVTPTEQTLLINRLHSQIALAQWGVLNHNDHVYQPAIQSAKTIASHLSMMKNHGDILADINALPNSLIPTAPKTKATKKEVLTQKKREVNS